MVSNYAVDYGEEGDYSLGTGGSYQAGTPDTIDIINVTIKEDSRIDKAGFIGGFCIRCKYCQYPGLHRRKKRYDRHE